MIPEQVTRGDMANPQALSQNPALGAFSSPQGVPIEQGGNRFWMTLPDSLCSLTSKSFVVTHKQLSFQLAQGIQCHPYHDQQADAR